jgi:hypothetical protein
VLSWIFRHRQRLSTIYGMVQSPALPGPRLAQAPPLQFESGPARRAGHLSRRGKSVVVRPMPPRAR